MTSYAPPRRTVTAAAPPSAVSPIQAVIDVDLLQKLSHCEDFDSDELNDIVITRRGTTFPIQLRTLKTKPLGWVDSAALVYAYDESKEVVLELVSLDVRVYGADLQVKDGIMQQ